MGESAHVSDANIQMNTTPPAGGTKKAACKILYRHHRAGLELFVCLYPTSLAMLSNISASGLCNYSVL